MPGCEESSARAHSIPGDRKKLPDVSCCVTTRGARRRRPLSRLRSPAARRPGMPSAGVAGVPPRHAAGASQDQHAISAAAWSPASDAPSSDIPALGSSVGCSSEPEIAARSLCKDKFAIPVAALWQMRRFGWYAELVPWEVLTPLGPPGEDGLILLGHSALDPSSLSACQLATARERFAAEAGRRNERNQTGCNDRADRIATKEKRKDTQQKYSGLEGDQGSRLPPRRPGEGQRSEGNRLGSPTARNRGRFQARPQ